MKTICSLRLSSSADEEALVVLLEHEHVVGLRRCPGAWRHTWYGRMASSGTT